MPATARIAAAAALAVTLAACSSGGVDSPAEVAASGPDGTLVTNQELADAVDNAEAAGQLDGVPEDQLPDTRLDLQRQVLSQLVQVELVSELAAERYDVSISDEAVEERLDEELEAVGGEAALEEQGLSRDAVRGQIEVQLLVEGVQEAIVDGLEVDDEDVREAYDERGDQWEQATVRHILLDTEAEALDAIQRLEDGEDFAALAEELSTGPSGPNGGLLGTSPRGVYVAPFEEAVWDSGAEVGEVIGPVETEFGFHVIRVDEYVTQEFEDVEAQLREELVQPRVNEEFTAFVDEALSVEVEVADRFGVWDAEQNLVVAG